jgi:hypothetical protein
MFVKVKLSGDLPIGTIVNYDDVNTVWTTAPNDTNLFGVLETTEQDEDLLWWGRVRFGNASRALADRAIPDEGGFLGVINGKVFVDATDHQCGVIAPLERGATSRVADDLVLVYLR